MKSLLWYWLAAGGEIAGCFAFWAWLRLGKSPLWTAPGVISLVIFALLLPALTRRLRAVLTLPMAGFTFSLPCSGCGW